MPEHRWLTLRERIALAKSGIIDDTITRVRPSPEELEAMRAEAEVYLAERGVKLPLAAPPPRRPARRRTSA
jgi:hypothetical protein